MKSTKRLIAMLLITAITAAIVGCGGKPAEHEPMDTPVRLGTEGSISTSLARADTLEELIEHSSLVADITITGWLGEAEHELLHHTIFSADVNYVFKGEDKKSIEIVQVGNSQYTYSSCPLFKKGDRLLIFLMEREWFDGSEINEEDWNEVFLGRYIMGSYLNVMDIWEHENELFVLSRYDGAPLSQSIVISDEVEMADEEKTNYISAEYAENDPIFGQFQYSGESRRHHGYAFNYNDLFNKVERVVSDQGQDNDDQGDDDDDGNDDDDSNNGNDDDQGGGNRRPQGGNEQ